MKAYTKNGSYCIACETLGESYEVMDSILSKPEIRMLFTDDYDFLGRKIRTYSLTFIADEAVANEVFNELGITEVINKD